MLPSKARIIKNKLETAGVDIKRDELPLASMHHAKFWFIYTDPLMRGLRLKTNIIKKKKLQAMAMNWLLWTIKKDMICQYPFVSTAKITFDKASFRLVSFQTFFLRCIRIWRFWKCWFPKISVHLPNESTAPFMAKSLPETSLKLSILCLEANNCASG